MNEALERMYQWYLLGCSLQETQSMSREDFEAEQMINLLTGGALASEVLDRSAAEWELAREDAYWTNLLQRLANMNLSDTASDLVTAIRRGRADGQNEDEQGPAGSSGVPVCRPPFVPTHSGAAALEIPLPDLPIPDLVGCAPGSR